MKNKLMSRILEEVEEIRIIDTHEHIMPEEERLNKELDLIRYFFLEGGTTNGDGYLAGSLLTSGTSHEVFKEIQDINKPLHDRWQKFMPHWKLVRNMCYGRVMIIAAMDLFGIPKINNETWQELSEKIRESNKLGWYEYVLKEKARIEISLNMTGFPSTKLDRRYFLPVPAFDIFMMITGRREITLIENLTGVDIHCLDDLLDALAVGFKREVEVGVVGIKSAIAYYRSLRFDKVRKFDAERVFNRVFNGSPQGYGLSWKEAKPLQDFMMHQIIKQAITYDLPIQIHTGILARRPMEPYGNIITNSNPTHLINLFMEYGKAKFDIFHGGFPYSTELTTIANLFPNVYLDLCWLYSFSPSVAKRMLHEWIETVPANKILAFGGDYVTVEGAYAHSKIARKVIAEVLTEKVKDGYFSEEDAFCLARRILRENPICLFKLGYH